MRVIELVSNKVWGGGERYVLDLCKALRADGADVEIYTRGIEAVDHRFKAEDFTPGKMSLGGLFGLRASLQLARRLRHINGPVTIHVHNFKDAEMAVNARSLAGVPREDVRIVCTRHLVKPAKKSSVYAQLDALIFVSELARDEFMRTKPEVNPDTVHVIHNSIQTQAAPKPSFSDGDELKLLFLGRINPEKGLDTLLHAMNLLPAELPVSLKIAGTGDEAYIRLLKSIVSQGVADVEWLGNVDNVYAEIAKCDVGVVPSRARESFGLVLLEFMSQGKPVISTDNGAQTEIITDGVEGILVPPESPRDLADAIERLANDKKLLASMGTAALRRFDDNFTYEKFYTRIKVVLSAPSEK